MNTTPFFSQRGQAPRRSSALLISLLMLSLITIIVVAFLGTMTWEISASRRNYDNQKARALAMLGMNTAVGQLRQALDTWDNPYYNFATNPPAYFWSVSPGIISRWSYTSTTPVTNYPLFSAGSTNLVNLNKVQGDGSYPIAGGSSPPNISVYWADVLKNPANATASAANPIIGRYAFWVDDESAKININTADGTMKYQTTSLGVGTPSEVSLQALQQGGSAISLTEATNIVYVARTSGFNSSEEILRATGTAPDIYTNNVFNLTACSRSPDLNIFGQPKMALMPILGDATSTNMAMNGITLQPPVEIYPTASQLPTYSIINPIGPTGYWSPVNTANPVTVPWPLAFRDQFGAGSQNNLNALYPNNASQDYTHANFCWINGMMLAQYLAGTNAAYKPISWPPFPGSSNGGFAAKYTPRQIDSIVAQILSLGSKEISPDYFYSSDSTGIYLPIDMQHRGRSVITTPFLLNGWLSHEWVSGLGRTPKVDAFELEYTTYGSIGSTNNLSTYTPPSTTLDIWQEWWLPAAYLGGHNVLPISNYTGEIYLGVREYKGTLNSGDLCQYLLSPPPTPPIPVQPPAPLPKPDSSGSYWGNQLMTNNQGMDFAGNPNNFQDPDQALAAQYHNPYALTNGVYYGTGLASLPNYSFFTTPLQLSQLQLYNPTQDWAPGEMRCIRSILGESAPMPMQTTADGSTLTIGGGISAHGAIFNDVPSDPDPAPLEGIRGVGYADSWYPMVNGEIWSALANSPGSSPTATVRDRFIQSVIPVNFTMSIPGNSSDGSIPGITKYVLATVADPLVNKFPGDWTVAYSDSAPTVPPYWSTVGNSITATFASANEYATSFHNSLADPDSYWLPQADCAISYLGDLASQTLIPRSARFPNIGYLQYLRTGIIPDDESLPYQPQPGQTLSQYQHGTPFRLLSFAPSTETANQETTRPTSNPQGTSQPYPDWALLDLLYVPSILAPFGGPYGYYDTNGPPVWQGYGNPATLANYSTGGGSTPGRINPNGAVLYTTNSTVPQPGIFRTLPMQAVLYGLKVNQHLVPTSDPFNNPNPGYTGGSTIDAPTIAQAIANYLANNGPIRMPAELCNVPEIAALRPPVNATRNDLVRQIVGALTTQSNTFSVWVDGESIAKTKGNTNYGIYESGDQVTASVRYHFIVERYLDPGADGIYGNAVNAGADGVVGTYDDPLDPVNHPFCPRYLYRIVSTEEIH